MYDENSNSLFSYQNTRSTVINLQNFILPRNRILLNYTGKITGFDAIVPVVYLSAQRTHVS